MIIAHFFVNLLDLGYRTVLHREQHASWFVRCIYGNQKHVYIAKGRSSQPACFRYMGVRYDVASAPKNCGGRPGWRRDKIFLCS